MNHHENENTQPWARRVDDWGKRRWPKGKPDRNRKGEYIGNIIFQLIFLWIVNNVQEWHLVFIKDNYLVVVWILNLNIFIQIGGNVLMFLVDIPMVRYLSKMITEAASFVTQLVIFYIFPFDFSNFHGLFWLNWFLPVALIIGMVVSALKVISNFWKLIFRRS